MNPSQIKAPALWLLVACLVTLLPGIATAQTVIQGTVKERESQKGVAGINVAIQEKGSAALVAYALTNEQGVFKLEYKGQKDSIIVSASGFNMSKQTKVVANKSQEVNFVTYSEAISLKEVKVVSKNIRKIGDTLNYSVSGYVDKNDRTIGDVLKKLPGIEVKDNGSVLYNNRPINGYYIEGMDLLKGRYGLANNNIQAKDVSAVQVMENHQPIKALQDREFSEDAAINLKLKESAKGTLILNALLGAGAGNDPDLLWTAEVSGMFFNKKMQNISTYKGNNTGDDVSRDQTLMFGPGVSGSGSPNWLSVQAPSSPAIRQNRYLKNQVSAFSINNLWALHKDYQLNANINYTNDRQDKSSYARSEYLLAGDSLLTIEERLTSRAYKNQGSADIILNANTKEYYLDNTLSFKGAWDSEHGNALTTTDSIYQHLDKPNYSLKNAFRWIKNYSKTSLTFASTNSYASTPNNLRVEPMLYEELFAPAVSLKGLRQDLLLNDFSSTNSLSFGFDHGRWKQNYSAGFNAHLQKLTTQLQPETDSGTLLPAPDSLKNDLQWNRYEWQVKPSYSYSYNRLRTTLGLPLQYVMLQVNDRIPAAETHTDRFFFNPFLFISYRLSPCWETFANATYQNSIGGINNAYTGYIMRSYRNLQRNEGSLYELRVQNYSLNLSYRNPIYALFGSMNASYTHQHANLLFGYNYAGILRVQTTYDLPNTTEGVNLSANLSKGVDVLSSTVSAGGTFSSSRASQINQGELVHFNSRQYGISGSIQTKIRQWASFSIRCEYTQSMNKVENDEKIFSPIRTFSQRTQFNLFPIRNLIINFSYEYFYNSAIVSGNRNISFGDINLRYKWNKAELMLDYSNIFNTKEYISASYSNTSTYYYAYNLRPAEIMLKARFKIK